MSILDHKLLKHASLQYTSTQECYMPRFVKANPYIKSSSNKNINTSENLISTESEAQVSIPNIPQIDNK